MLVVGERAEDQHDHPPVPQVAVQHDLHHREIGRLGAQGPLGSWNVYRALDLDLQVVSRPGGQGQQNRPEGLDCRSTRALIR